MDHLEAVTHLISPIPYSYGGDVHRIASRAIYDIVDETRHPCYSTYSMVETLDVLKHQHWPEGLWIT